MFVFLARRGKGLIMSALLGLFFIGIVLELIFVLPFAWMLSRVKGSEPQRMQQAHRILFKIWLFLMKISGLLAEKKPIGEPYPGPCLIVANHPGLFDVLFLICRIPRLSMIVKSSLAVDLPLGKIFELSGYITAPQTSQASPVAALLEARNMIAEGYKFLLFPEGTRSPKGGLHHFGSGLFRLAHMAGVPIQPVLIRNQPPFMAHEDKWRNPPLEVSTIQLEFWEPLAPPKPGQEREFARMMEMRYRKALEFTDPVPERLTGH